MKKAILLVSVALNLALIAFHGRYWYLRRRAESHARANALLHERSRSYLASGMKCVYLSGKRVLYLKDSLDSPLLFCYQGDSGGDVVTASLMQDKGIGEISRCLSWTSKMTVAFDKDKDDYLCLFYNDMHFACCSNGMLIVRSPCSWPKKPDESIKAL